MRWLAAREVEQHGPGERQRDQGAEHGPGAVAGQVGEQVEQEGDGEQAGMQASTPAAAVEQVGARPAGR